MRKLNGYRATHRNKWILVSSGILTRNELMLLEFYADILDFDKDHADFGLIHLNFEEIAKLFNCKSDTTIRNWHNKLLKLGFIKSTNRKLVFNVCCFERYISPGFWQGKAAEFAALEKDQPIETILQNFGINFHEIGTKLQSVGNNDNESASELTTKALGSSKDELSSNASNQQVTRSEEEYKRIWAEMGNPQNFDISDMKWIDRELCL